MPKESITNIELMIVSFISGEAWGGKSIIFIYRILCQLINKEKDIITTQDAQEFWKLFRENILKNAKDGIGKYINNEFKNIDFSVENIQRIYNLCEGKENILNSDEVKKNDETAKSILMLVKDALEYIGINIGNNNSKKRIFNEDYKKYLESSILKRKNIEKKIDNMISKL